MNAGHDRVPSVLAAWVLGVCEPAEDARVRAHLRQCADCRSEADRLRVGVPRPILNGGRAVAPPALRARTLAAASAARRPDRPVGEYAACYADAVATLDALLGEVMPRQDPAAAAVIGDAGVVGEGWDLPGVLAHLIATDGVLCVALGVPEAVPSGIPATAGPGDPEGLRSARVLARLRTHTLGQAREMWREQAGRLMRAAGPVNSAADVARLVDAYADRAFETWIHTGDLARLFGLRAVRPLRLDQLIAYGLRALGPMLADRTPVSLVLTGSGGGRWTLPQGRHGAAATITADAVEFCLLFGGRRTPASVRAEISGSAPVARAALAAAAALAPVVTTIPRRRAPGR
ncbi:maleylpyruvate isomerase family mycothiol-dependent enzyme [Embleya sp. NBC_00896]|uniref:maleylpyruvate isomerase family mycothiol-dependent enzyme n=1 Tax=Embleya sp. NBC_00896 TaxID=2975961 RepID=UPI002F90DF3C|nr:maleylpyruvate isomerase family mycothiol-dependent enzyme [Embleya sp. NBC_00896]